VTFARLLLHPVMIHRRSRALLFWYVLSATALSALLWWRVDQLTAQSGLSLAKAAAGAPPLARIFFQPYFRILIALLSAALATGITAISIVGPIRRIEEWLAAWEVGLKVNPLKVRVGDQYETMIRLLNELNLKSSRMRAAQPKRSRTPMHKPIRPSRRPS
jgi:hypothetical protein